MPSPGRAMTHWSHAEIDHDLMHLEHDPTLAAKIMKKRQQERDRCSNRLTPRMQRIGLDIAALNGQCFDKQAAAEVKRGESERYLEGMLLKQNMIGEAETVIKAKLRSQQQDCIAHNFTHLNKHQRREWDLSDPNQLKYDKPGRIEGSKPAYSSFQRFEGEEGVSPQVVREKRQMQVDWLMSQMAEKKLKEQLEKDCVKRDDASVLEGNELRVAVEMAQAQEQKEEVMQVVKENQLIASARSARRVAAHERDAARTKEHMTNESEHNLMRERHDYSIGLNGKKRDYKRCSYDEEVATWDVNRALVEAKLNRKRSQAHVDDEYHQIGMTVDVLGREYDDAWSQMNLRRRSEINAANTVMAQERKEQNKQDRVDYTSFASPR